MALIAFPDIQRVSAAGARQLSDVLARAFEDDPVFGWVIPDATRRRARLPGLFSLFAEAYLPRGETYMATDAAGAAVGLPAGSELMDADSAEAFGERLAEVLGDDASRATEVNAALQEHHPVQPSFYLFLLGVVPERRNQGLGGRMLASVLRGCDAAGVPAYLEATGPGNRRLYARHGFETVGEITVPHGPTLWPMWREPALPTSAPG